MSYLDELETSYLDESNPEDDEFLEYVKHLAVTLESLKPDLDSGRLAVGYIWERYNESCKPELKISSPRAMGARLRGWGLTITAGVHDSNGRRAVKCLVWDKKTEMFIAYCLDYKGSMSRQNEEEEMWRETWEKCGEMYGKLYISEHLHCQLKAILAAMRNDNGVEAVLLTEIAMTYANAFRGMPHDSGIDFVCDSKKEC